MTAAARHGNSWTEPFLSSTQNTPCSVFCKNFVQLRACSCRTARDTCKQKERAISAFSATSRSHSYVFCMGGRHHDASQPSLGGPCDALTQHSPTARLDVEGGLCQRVLWLNPRLPAGGHGTMALCRKPAPAPATRAIPGLGLCGAAAQRLIRRPGRRAPSRTTLGPPPSLA